MSKRKKNPRKAQRSKRVDRENVKLRPDPASNVTVVFRSDPAAEHAAKLLQRDLETIAQKDRLAWREVIRPIAADFLTGKPDSRKRLLDALVEASRLSHRNRHMIDFGVPAGLVTKLEVNLELSPSDVRFLQGVAGISAKKVIRSLRRADLKRRFQQFVYKQTGIAVFSKKVVAPVPRDTYEQIRFAQEKPTLPRTSLFARTKRWLKKLISR